MISLRYFLWNIMLLILKNLLFYFYFLLQGKQNKLEILVNETIFEVVRWLLLDFLLQGGSVVK